MEKGIVDIVRKAAAGTVIAAGLLAGGIGGAGYAKPDTAGYSVSAYRPGAEIIRQDINKLAPYLAGVPDDNGGGNRRWMKCSVTDNSTSLPDGDGVYRRWLKCGSDNAEQVKYLAQQWCALGKQGEKKNAQANEKKVTG